MIANYFLTFLDQNKEVEADPALVEDEEVDPALVVVEEAETVSEVEKIVQK